MRRLLLPAVIAILLAACVGRPAEDATGQEIYLQLCSNCHSDQLEGGLVGPALGPGSTSAQLPDEFLRVTILQGRGSMPSFESSLSGDQVNRLIAYIREVQAR